MNSEFLVQKDKPLFPDLVWSRPETKHGAGKLLIIGGQAQEFINVAEIYALAENAGAGVVRVLMPESTRKITGTLPNIEYAASNKSGSFAAEALNELLVAADWADGVLLAGDMGKNSETALMLGKFVREYTGLLIIGGNSLQSLSLDYSELLIRHSTVISLNFNEMQKCALGLGLETPLTSHSSNSQIADILKTITKNYPSNLIMQNNGSVWTAEQEKCALTYSKKQPNQIAAQSSVWIIQNPTKIFQAITTAVYC